MSSEQRERLAGAIVKADKDAESSACQAEKQQPASNAEPTRASEQKEAKKDEYFYNLIINNKLDTYWSKVGGQSLSPEFKDLILKMFSYDGSKRPTIDELKSHPWMSKGCDIKGIRSDLVERLSQSRSEKRLNLVRQPESQSNLKNYKFNDKTDFMTECDPGWVIEKINEFNAEQEDDRKYEIEINEEK